MAHFGSSSMHWSRYTCLIILILWVGLLKAGQGLDFSKIGAFLKSNYGAEAYERGVQWQQLLDKYQTQPKQSQLKAVNDFFNQLTFADDIYVWEQEDYWATPVEFIGRGAGDCEDYTLAKYFSLVEMGFPADKLRLMYVKAVEFNQHHMVLTYYPKKGAEPLVLDNIDPKIKPAGQRQDLIPIYSFNADYLWLAKARGGGKMVGGSERLSLWQDILTRQSEYLVPKGSAQQDKPQ
ncbi:sulfate adenylyltransferase [Ferrimonas sp. YFM]|nr:sulfate adenylyltransferase [Ferrimonas sp. YFM]